MTVEVKKEEAKKEEAKKEKDPKMEARRKLMEERKAKQSEINKRVIPNKINPNTRTVTIHGTLHHGNTHEDRDLTVAELQSFLGSGACQCIDHSIDLTNLNAKSVPVALIPSGSIIESVGFKIIDPIDPPEAKLSMTDVDPENNPTLLVPTVLKSDKCIDLTSDVNLMGGTVQVTICYRCP